MYPKHMGDLHGLKLVDAIRSKPDAYKAFSSDDRSQEIPSGGESLAQLSERCVSYLNTIAAKHKGERVIVVSHGASIEELCRYADPTSSVRKRIPNTSICVFHISGTLPAIGSSRGWERSHISTKAAFCRMHLAAMGPLRNA